MKTMTFNEIMVETNLTFKRMGVGTFRGEKYFGYTNSFNIYDPRELDENVVYFANWNDEHIPRHVSMDAIRRGNLIYLFESIESVELIEALSEELDDIVEVYRLAEIQTTL
jgi:hypothetical protein